MLERLGDRVRNSPLLNRKAAQSYSLAAGEDDDPFTKGIYFHVEYIGALTLAPSAGKGVDMNDTAVEQIYKQEKGPHRRFSVLVTDKSLRLKDVTTKQLVDDVPMYAISYCGTSIRYPRTFSFICRDHDTGNMRVHVMRAGDRAKAQAMIVTVSKAFNIAYLAWQAANKQKIRSGSVGERKGGDSPRVTKKIQELNESVRRKKEAEAAESATAASSSEQRSTATAQVTQKLADVAISPETAAAKKEEDDIDDLFTELASSRSNPDILENDIGADPHRFSWDDTKNFADSGSTPNLLD